MTRILIRVNEDLENAELRAKQKKRKMQHSKELSKELEAAIDTEREQMKDMSEKIQLMLGRYVKYYTACGIAATVIEEKENEANMQEIEKQNQLAFEAEEASKQRRQVVRNKMKTMLEISKETIEQGITLQNREYSDLLDIP